MIKERNYYVATADANYTSCARVGSSASDTTCGSGNSGDSGDSSSSIRSNETKRSNSNDMKSIGIEITRLKEAREGRDTQLYNEQGIRMVAGGVILNNAKNKVLMISSSTKRYKWIIPKGGIEMDEADDFAKASLRECWEEAGISNCKSVKFICEVYDRTIGRMNKDGFPKAKYHFYQLENVELTDDYPESGKRDRKWCSFDECIKELIASDRPPLIDAVRSSDLKRD